MGKVCRFYYGTVINEEGDTWIPKYSHHIEPVWVWGEDPLGKNPEYCCEDMKYALENSLLTTRTDFPPALAFIRRSGPGPSGYSDDHAIHFCPFCRAEMEFREHLKLKVIAVSRTILDYHYEAI